MGFFSSFFKKITQPTLDSSNLVEPPSDISNLKQSASVNPNLRKYNYDPDMFDFEDEHEKDIEKWNRRIDNAEPSSGDNPDKKVAAYEKAIELCNEFESFCSDFPGGTVYYLENEQSRRDELERDLEDYLSEDYEEEKRFYEEEKRSCSLPLSQR